MKKILLLIGLVAGVSLSVNAQHFVTSFGFELGWGIPLRVQNTIQHDYYGYDIVHATQVNRYGISFFDVLLQGNNGFIEVSVRNDGFINRRAVYNHNPLYNHICSNQCGYHANYYTAYNGHCNSHNHHGHNHVAYINYSKPKHGHGHGNAYGHYKDNDHKKPSHKNYNSRSVAKRETYTRRDRYYDDKKEEGNRNRLSRVKYNGNTGRTRSGN
jgi:hypothetical protein